MDYAETEGTSIDDAIERALQRLGVSRDKVDIEIISNATRGLFGFGGRRAKVRATLRRPLALGGEAASARPAPTTSVTPRTPAPPAPASAPPPASAPARTTAAPAQQSAAPRPRRPPTPPRRNPAPRPAHSPRPTPAALDGASIDRARGVLTEIVRLMGSPGGVEIAQDDDGVRLVISGDPSGALIGRRGQTLDALEYVINRVMAHEDEPISRLVVDLEDYRLRRRQALEALAQRVAERARRRGKPVSLNPMSPRDRRVVHLALQGDPTLTTRSAGTGFYRKVVIVPATRRPRQGDS
jgi:spoIIIJ-associated protein